MGILILFLAVLVGCSRNFESPYLTGPSETGGPGLQPGSQPVAQPIAQPVAQPSAPDSTQPLNIVMVESIVAANLRMTVGETRNAQVRLLPANVTSPNYSLSSQNSTVAIVRPGGIFAMGEGTTTITAHALDGSDKIGQFQVSVVSGENKEKDKDD